MKNYLLIGTVLLILSSQAMDVEPGASVKDSCDWVTRAQEALKVPKEKRADISENEILNALIAQVDEGSIEFAKCDGKESTTAILQIMDVTHRLLAKLFAIEYTNGAVSVQKVVTKDQAAGEFDKSQAIPMLMNLVMSADQTKVSGQTSQWGFLRVVCDLHNKTFTKYSLSEKMIGGKNLADLPAEFKDDVVRKLLHEQAKEAVNTDSHKGFIVKYGFQPE